MKGYVMRLKLLRPYGLNRVGDVLNTVPRGRAIQFIKNGVAVPVEDEDMQQKKTTRRKKGG